MQTSTKTKQQAIIESLLAKGENPHEVKCRKCHLPFANGCQCYINEKWISFSKPPAELTDEDIKHLLTAFKVKENITQIMKSMGKLTTLASHIRSDIKKFEKGEGIDREKLGQDIDQLRKEKHELRSYLLTLKFGKFQELLTGEVSSYNQTPNYSEKPKPSTKNHNTSQPSNKSN